MGTPLHIWGHVLMEQPSKGWRTGFTPVVPPATLLSQKDAPLSTPTSIM